MFLAKELFLQSWLTFRENGPIKQTKNGQSPLSLSQPFEELAVVSFHSHSLQSSHAQHREQPEKWFKVQKLYRIRDMVSGKI